ncbi:predicted protein [Uncinocarpus reesii 1704]|uniref:Uncharacterized protein n=1 Tax=Uncinocarpus reesii (strain UAMH 1704) TaxID=336963 RepID=C4JMM8_UNCRE|nr:uncharacterized protein UREG_04086 [Uncinocarpus reesii 1704]EEP79240.1 predicted protein [Uncinocarpus reesii 1704]
MLPFVILWSLLVRLVLSNVEKAIFVAPPIDAAQFPAASLRLENLSNLGTLSPSTPSIRQHLNASFPSETNPLGVKSWFRLANLSPGQRYEVRICWLATQPTSFDLNLFTASDILDSSSLLSSFTTFCERHQLANQRLPPLPNKSPNAITLFLAVDAAADYFTLNQTLMESVPPVAVDIILDAYLMNIFPRSLIPTAVYVACVVVVAWRACRFVQSLVNGIISSGSITEISAEQKSK